jgi:tetratricopeptide (TPR) repeat protein
MLETLREYALERLAMRGDLEVTRRRHATFYLSFALEAEVQTHGPDQLDWFERLEEERDNLRSAASWSLAEEHDRELGFQLVGALWWFWAVRGHLSEGRGWAERMLALPGVPNAPARAKVVCGAGTLAMQLGDHQSARLRLEESLALCRELGDRRGCALALVIFGMLMIDRGDRTSARPRLEESVHLFREVGDRWGIAFALFGFGDALVMSDTRAARCAYEESLALYRDIGDKQGISLAVTSLGRLDLMRGDYLTAQTLFEEGLALRRELGDRWLIAISLTGLGGVARCQGDDRRAEALFREALAIQRDLGNRHGIAWVLQNLGDVARQQGDEARAVSLLYEALAIRRDQGHEQGIALCIVGLAGIALVACQPHRAARLLGTATTKLDALGAGLDPADRLAYNQTLEEARTALGPAQFAAAWATGASMTLEQACIEALAESCI